LFTVFLIKYAAFLNKSYQPQACLYKVNKCVWDLFLP